MTVKTFCRFLSARLLITTPAILLFGGCASQLHWDATRMRAHSLDFYSDEIMDNLIRGKNGLLFLHTDITLQQAQVNTSVSSNASGGETRTGSGTRAISLDGITNTIVRSATRPFAFSLSPTVADNLQTQTKPVVNDVEVYKPYLQFLNLERPNQRLQDSDFDPKLQNVKSVRIRGNEKLREDIDYIHGTLRRWNGKEYYIPSGYKQAYFDLCMAVVGRIKGATSPGTAVDATPGAPSGAKPRSRASELPPKPYSLPLQLDAILDEVRSRQ